MGGIIAEASGTSIAREVQETIDAVKIAATGRPDDDGATAFEVAKLLKLDKSSAWRRLRVGMDKDYITNLETRKGQLGRYRLTDQEIEAEELLPSAQTLGGAVQPLQPRNPKPKAKMEQGNNRFTTGCAPMQPP